MNPKRVPAGMGSPEKAFKSKGKLVCYTPVIASCWNWKIHGGSREMCRWSEWIVWIIHCCMNATCNKCGVHWVGDSGSEIDGVIRTRAGNPWTQNFIKTIWRRCSVKNLDRFSFCQRTRIAIRVGYSDDKLRQDSRCVGFRRRRHARYCRKCAAWRLRLYSYHEWRTRQSRIKTVLSNNSKRKLSRHCEP